MASAFAATHHDGTAVRNAAAIWRARKVELALRGAETMTKALGEGRKIASSGLAGVGLQLGRRWLVLQNPKALTLPAKLY